MSPATVPRPLTPHGPPRTAILVTFQCRSLAPSHPQCLLLVLEEGAGSSIHNHSIAAGRNHLVSISSFATCVIFSLSLPFTISNELLNCVLRRPSLNTNKEAAGNGIKQRTKLTDNTANYSIVGAAKHQVLGDC